MVKVGLLTGSVIPSPCASPLVNTVFPTPRSPTSVMTCPGFALSLIHIYTETGLIFFSVIAMVTL